MNERRPDRGGCWPRSCAGSPPPRLAQESRGTITGTVAGHERERRPRRDRHRDQRGDGAPTSPSSPTMSASFQAPYLIPGAYRVSVELAGFKKFVRDGLDVTGRRSARARAPARAGRHARGSDRQRRGAAARDDQRLARAGRGRAARRRAPDAARRSVLAHRPGRGHVLRDVGATRSSVRADPHRRLLGERHAVEPQRHHD